MVLEIRGYIISIIGSIFFMFIGTLIWQKLHYNYEMTQSILKNMESSEVYVSEEVILDNLVKISDNESKKINSHSFILNNDTNSNKSFYIKLVDDYYSKYHSLNKIDNNYLRYTIKKDDGKYSEARSLNMNGQIYFDEINANSEAVYELKLWVSENYSDEFDYHGNIVVVYS